jgi:hypothetical protein
VAGDDAEDTHDLAEMAVLGTVEVLFVGGQAAIGMVKIDHRAASAGYSAEYRPRPPS